MKKSEPQTLEQWLRQQSELGKLKDLIFDHELISAIYEKHKDEIWEFTLSGDSKQFNIFMMLQFANEQAFIKGEDKATRRKTNINLLVKFAVAKIGTQVIESTKSTNNRTSEQTQERAELQARIGKDQQITQERRKGHEQNRQAQQSRDQDGKVM